MSRQQLVALVGWLLALSGAFGLVSIPLVRIGLPTVLRVILALLALIVVIIWTLASQLPQDLPRRLRVLAANNSRASRAYVLTSKHLVVEVSRHGGARRDARCLWQYGVHNGSGEVVAEVRLPLLGEVAVEEGDLEVLTAVDGRALGRAWVDYRDNYSPTVVVQLPAPGLPPNADAKVTLAYTWPGLARIAFDTWALDLVGVLPGGVVSAELRYPCAVAQTADVQILHQRAMWRTTRALGRVLSDVEDDTAILRYAYTRKRGDLVVLIATHHAPQQSAK